jgi:hypothetical protein
MRVIVRGQEKAGLGFRGREVQCNSTAHYNMSAGPFQPMLNNRIGELCQTKIDLI